MVTPISGNLPAQTAQAPVVLPTTTASVEQTTLPAIGQNATQSGVSSGTTTPNPPQLQEALDTALRNTGFKSEVDTTDPNQVVVRIVDAVTGKTVVQTPSATALAIAQAIRRETNSETASGALLDEAV